MRNVLLAMGALMLVGCTTPEMRTLAANDGPQLAPQASMSQSEAPPPRQLSQPRRTGWASNSRSTPR